VCYQDQEVMERFKHKDVNADAESDSAESEHSGDNDHESVYTAALL